MADFILAKENDGSEWINIEAFNDVFAALKNCVDFWPAALNDDLQGQTFQSARIIVEEIESERRKARKLNAPYGEWCRDPDLCAGKGYCPRDPTCGD